MSTAATATSTAPASRAKAAKNRGAKAGYVDLHSIIDGYSRLAYTEPLSDVWKIHCNYHPPHSAASGRPPASRLNTGVTNVRPSYS